MNEGIAEAADIRERPVSFERARSDYQSLIFAFVSRRVKPIEEAQDVTAQVFVDAYRQWRKLRGSAKLYLLGIARNKIKDALRRKNRLFPLREEDYQASSLDDFVSYGEASAAFEIAMRLPADERDAILMQVLEEMPVDQIAEILGRSVKATNSLLQRARGRIRKLAASELAEGGSQ